MKNAGNIDFEKQTFTDRIMFAKVMEDKERCRRVLECLLGCSVGVLNEVVSERQLLQTEDGKMIRLDIYTYGEESVYDIEMQNKNNKSLEFLQLPKRSRFYQSLIDEDFLRNGESYKNLPENNVIFICTFDPFGRGLPVYEFENRTNEIPPKPLNDGCRIYFFNCAYEGTDIPKQLKNFYDFVRTESVNDALTEDLKKAVEDKRMSYIYRSDYLRQIEDRIDAKDEGREEGREEERIKTEEQRKRAEAAEKRAEEANKRIAELEALVKELKKK